MVFRREYPNNAQAASSMVGVAALIASLLFTVLYVVNCLNLFAPFLLFPASQVKLASMLASLTLNKSILDDGRGLRFRRRKMQTMPSPQGDRMMEEQAEGWGLKHQQSYASLVATEGKVTSEGYTSSQHGMSDSMGSMNVMEGMEGHLRDHPFRRIFSGESGTGIVSAPVSHNDTEYPPKSTPTSPSTTQNRSLAATSPSGQGATTRAKIAAQVVKLFSTPSTTEIGSGIFKGDKAMACGAPPLSANDSLNSAPGTCSTLPTSGTTKSSSWPSPPPLSKVQTRKDGDVGSTGKKDTVQCVGARSPKAASEKAAQRPKAAPRGAQLVLDSLISSHALPIQGFYCQTGALKESASGLQLYQRPDRDAELGIAMSMFGGLSPAPRRNKPRPQHERTELSLCPSPDQPPQMERQLRHQSFEATEQLESPIAADFDASMGEASNRRRQKLRQQFRSQVEQRRRSELLSLSTIATRNTHPDRDTHDVDSPTDTVPQIVAHPPSPAPSSPPSAPQTPWLDPSRPSPDERHNTVISLPMGFHTSVSEDGEDEGAEMDEIDDDSRSIVSDSFGGI